MFERPQIGERAVLVHVSFARGEDIDPLAELTELTTSAGALPVSVLSTSREAPDTRFFVGSGKVEEIAERIRETEANLVVFDHALSPAQERNLERALQCRVLDRISLILDIFAQRAHTFEGQLQVELAQLRHLSTRLVRGWTHLERQKGGIGLRGPGEKQLETDRRLLVDRIKYINRRLQGVQKRRALSRRSRGKAEVPVVALVGYTNAGKSTLFNQLTGAKVVAADRLFETLDPKLRRLKAGPVSPLVIADTVGFIRHLPHELVAAFRATLEETRSASLLLHVVDASDPDREEKKGQVNSVLNEIGADHVKQIEVYNKIDLVGCEARIDRDENEMATRIWVSASDGAGLDELRGTLTDTLGPTLVRHRFCLPASAGRLRARLFELGEVLHETTVDEGWQLVVEIPAVSLERLRGEGLEASDIAAPGQPTYDPNPPRNDAFIRS